MDKRGNLRRSHRKEQCITVDRQLRTMKIQNYKICCLARDGIDASLHPADGVFPEMVSITPFARLQEEVKDAGKGANDNILLLGTLKPFSRSGRSS